MFLSRNAAVTEANAVWKTVCCFTIFLFRKEHFLFVTLVYTVSVGTTKGTNGHFFCFLLLRLREIWIWHLKIVALKSPKMKSSWNRILIASSGHCTLQIISQNNRGRQHELFPSECWRFFQLAEIWVSTRLWNSLNLDNLKSLQRAVFLQLQYIIFAQTDK